MNFLSHFYLDREQSDHFFTMGLITPDLVSFANKKARLTKKIIHDFDYSLVSKEIASFSAGMVFHIEIDKWFHRSDFFKTSIQNMKRDFNALTNRFLHEFYAHILIEIFIDRFLIKENSQLIPDFYNLQKEFDFKTTTPFFKTITNFDIPNFLKFTTKFADSDFFYDYLEFEKIKEIIKRVAFRVKINTGEPIELLTPDFLKQQYEKLLPDIPFILEKSRTLQLNKNAIINKLTS